MQRSAAIALVVLSSLMLGTTPCCRISGYAGVATELGGGNDQSDSQRGPSESDCSCCSKADSQPGSRTSTLASGCGSPTLHGVLDRPETQLDDVPLALPVFGEHTRQAPARRMIAALARAPDVPRAASRNLPLLL